MKINLTDEEHDGSSHFDLAEKTKKLKLDNFRGTLMRDQLKFSPLQNKCGILNLNTND